MIYVEKQLYLKVNWEVPKHVHAYVTTRTGGTSPYPYHFNLSDYVQDHLANVEANHKQLQTDLDLPTRPCWLKQIHSNQVIHFDQTHLSQRVIEKPKLYKSPVADASITQTAKLICTVLTADCLPVLLCNQSGTEVAAIHAGWQGLAKDIIWHTVQKCHSKPWELTAWIGPGISLQHFEVNEEIREQFIQKYVGYATAFHRLAPHTPRPDIQESWHADLYALARTQLTIAGVKQIELYPLCTYHNRNLCFSYRRDGALSGRMASLIWFD